jgi:hypothetical protein
VVNYRTPRHKQWISIWKQLASLETSLFKTGDRSYKEWICDTDSDSDSNNNNNNNNNKVWEYLDCVANPLGLVHELLTKLPSMTAITVTLLDIGDISNKGLDIYHVSACDILNLPCMNGWVRGIHNRTLLVNPKTKALDNDITKTELDKMEWNGCSNNAIVPIKSACCLVDPKPIRSLTESQSCRSFYSTTRCSCTVFLLSYQQQDAAQLDELESNDDILGSVIWRKCRDFADGISHLASQMEGHNQEERQ